MAKMPVLITGRTGQLGNELQRQEWPDDFEPVSFGSADFDLRDLGGIVAKIDRGHGGRPWAAVVNAGAYTAVDMAESEAVDAWLINALAPAAIAEVCARHAIPLVHFSTDYVFDGSKAEAWAIDDPVGPLNTYGASKLGGELAIRASGARHAIIRTSWVVSAHGRNFVKTMLRLAENSTSLRIVSDQRGSPTSAADLARTAVVVVARLVTDQRAPGGTYHFSNAGATNWAEVAAEVFRQSAQHGGPHATVEPIATSDYPTPARRPQNSLLSHDAIRDDFCINPRPWAEAIGDIVAEILGTRR